MKHETLYIVCCSIIGTALSAGLEIMRAKQRKRDAELLKYTVDVVLPNYEERMRESIDKCVEKAFDVDLS